MMKKGIVCFSFDDGRKDNREIAEYLMDRKIPASFNITSGYVDGTSPIEQRPCQQREMSIDDVKWIHRQRLFEVALHGNNHLNTKEDIDQGRDKVISWLDLPANSKLGFASPGTGLKLDLIDEEQDLFYNKISYIRISLRIQSLKFIRVMARKVGRVLHIPILYKIAYADTLMKVNEINKLIYSVPVMKDATYKQVRALVNMCAKRGKVLVLMFHSIEEKPLERDNWSWEKEKFEMLCEYMCSLVEQDKIEILTVQEMYNRSKGIS